MGDGALVGTRPSSGGGLVGGTRLIARAIEDDRVRLPDTLAVLRYRQRRNYAAYRSHRKRTRARLDRRPSRRRKRKIS